MTRLPRASAVGWLPVLEVACVLGVAAWQLATIRAGHDWGGDFALYVAHARNLAEGRPYTATGYIFNPHNPIGPSAYPPVFPLFLAPIIKFRGLDFIAMKIEVVMWLVATLPLMLRLFRRELGPHALLLVAVIGMSPFVTDLKNSVLSDTAFLFFTILTAVLRQATAAPSHSWRASLAAGSCAGIAFGIRSPGALLMVAMVADDLLTHRRIERRTAVAAAPFAILASVAVAMAPGTGGYFEILGHAGPSQVAFNVHHYLGALAPFWTNGAPIPTGKAMAIVATLIALRSLPVLSSDRPIFLELFTAGYLLMIAVWPEPQGTRFLLPVMPVYLFHVMRGLRLLGGDGRRALWAVAAAGVVIGTVVIYTASYRGMDYGPYRSGPLTARYQAAFAQVTSQTPAGAVIIFEKPTVLALFTGRRSTVPFEPADDAVIFAYMSGIGACYVAYGPFPDPYLERLVARNSERFEPAPLGDGLSLYRTRFCGAAPA